MSLSPGSDLARRPREAFRVVNRMDEINSPEERSEIERRLRMRLEPVVGGVRVQKISAFDALDAIAQNLPAPESSGVPELQREVLEFLARDRAAADISFQVDRRRRTRSELLRWIDQREADLAASNEDSERRIQRLREMRTYAEDDCRSIESATRGEFAAILDGAVYRVIDVHAGEMKARFDALNRRGGEIDAETLRRLADEEGGRGLTAIQREIRDNVSRLLSQVSERLTVLFSTVAQPDMAGGDVVQVAPVDFASMVQIHTTTTEVVEEQPRSRSNSGDVTIGALVGGLGALLRAAGDHRRFRHRRELGVRR